ncbi:hypothetical protein KSX_26500 [Ktedonospora formicarum]|uniref:Uncharacterized protein n=1 Tax=Ktedonospora formicarum TaxID=2778364 RepID=A0A8J3MQ46_9CHLR|nr:hypothetical protein KSX_26500 [Ktedonospora formicarum]
MTQDIIKNGKREKFAIGNLISHEQSSHIPEPQTPNKLLALQIGVTSVFHYSSSSTIEYTI